jgi:hypothetical protein
MPVKITAAGGYAFKINIRGADRVLITSTFVRLTRATPAPMVAEKALMTLTAGINHVVNLL